MSEQENNQAKLNTTQVKPAETKAGMAKTAAAPIAQTAAAEAKAAKVKAAEAKAAKIKAAEAKAAEAKAAKVKAAEVKAAEAKAAKVKAAEAKAAEAKAAEAKAAEVKAAEARAAQAKAAEVKAAEVKAAEAKAAEAKAAEAKAAKVKAAEVKAAEAKAAEAKAAEAKAAEAKAAKVKAAEVKAAKAAEAKAAEIKAAEVKAAEAKATELKAAEERAAEVKAAEAQAAKAKAAEAKAAEDKTVGTDPLDDLLVAAKETAGESSSLNIPALVNTFNTYAQPAFDAMWQKGSQLAVTLGVADSATVTNDAFKTYAQPAYDTAWQYGSQLAAKMGLAADYNEHSTLVKGAIELAGVAGAVTGAFAAITTLAPISAPVIAFSTAAAAVGAINYQNGDNLVAHGFKSIGEYCDTQFYNAATNVSLFAGVPMAAAAFYEAGMHAQNSLHSGSIAKLKTALDALKPVATNVAENDAYVFDIYATTYEQAMDEALAIVTDLQKDSSSDSNAATVVGNIAAATIHISLETLKGGAGAVIITGGLLALASAASSIYAYATDDLEQDDALMDLAQHRDTGYHSEVSEMSSHDAQLQDLVLAGVHADGLQPA